MYSIQHYVMKLVSDYELFLSKFTKNNIWIKTVEPIHGVINLIVLFTEWYSRKCFKVFFNQRKCIIIQTAQKTFIIKTTFIYASVAQWIRHRPPKPGIAGSSPVGGKEFLLDAFCYFLICDSHNLIFCTHHAFSHHLEI